MTHEEFQKHIQKHDRVLAFFSSAGCSVCEALQPKVERLLEQKDFDDWALVKVTSNESPAVAGQLLVFAAPTLVFFRDGREVGRLARAFGLEDVRRKLERGN